MSLGETIDRARSRHLRQEHPDFAAAPDRQIVAACGVCADYLEIQIAYEDMIHELHLMGRDNRPPSFTIDSLPPAPEWPDMAPTRSFIPIRRSALEGSSDETYESVLPRDPDFKKAEAA